MSSWTNLRCARCNGNIRRLEQPVGRYFYNCLHCGQDFYPEQFRRRPPPFRSVPAHFSAHFYGIAHT